MDTVFVLAPGVGFEPTTKWLTATCSTAELPRNILLLKIASVGNAAIVREKKKDGKGHLFKTWLKKALILDSRLLILP